LLPVGHTRLGFKPLIRVGRELALDAFLLFQLGPDGMFASGLSDVGGLKRRLIERVSRRRPRYRFQET